MAVFNFGSVNIDYVYHVPHFVAPGETLSSTDYQKILGGKGANQSIALAKAGVSTHHVGAIASLDTEMVLPMVDAGVNTDELRKLADTPSGHAIIQVSPEGENSIILFAGANHTFTDGDIDRALSNASNDDWVLLQNETNKIADVIEAAHERGVKVAFNPAPMTPETSKLPLEKLSLLVVNEIEAMQLTGTSSIEDAKAALRKNFSNTQVVMTLGKDGSEYMFEDTVIRQSAFVVDAVDTTAAGDTFIGYFLATLIETNSVESALARASAASAISVTRSGAAPSVPSAEEVDAFLQANAK